MLARGVLRHTDFRRLWLGQVISTTGDGIVIVALALYIVQLTGSASDLGLVLAAYTLPLVAVLLIGGVVADRLSRKWIMVTSDLVRFAVHGLLAALIFTGAAEIWMLAAIGAVYGAAEGFFRPAYSGLLPQTVPEEEIQAANALSSGSTNAAELTGPALATALVLGAGAGWAFAVDAATFLVSAGFLVFVRARERGAPAEDGSMLRDLVDGFRHVRSRAWVWVTIVVFSFALFVSLAPWEVLGALVAKDEYGSAAVFGVAAAAFGGGTILGALVGLRLRPRLPMRAAMLCALPWPLAIGVFALGAPPAVVYVAMAVGGAGIALFDVWWVTALAQRIPPEALSRVSAYDWMGSLGLIPLGYVLAGFLAEAVGARELLLAGSVLGFVVLAMGLLSREVRDLEALPEAIADPG